MTKVDRIGIPRTAFCAAALLTACVQLPPGTSGSEPQVESELENVWAPYPMSSEAIAMAAYLRGRLLQVEGRMEEALEEYERVVAMDPRSASAQRALSQVWSGLGDPVRAREHAAAAVELDPTSVELRRELAFTLMATDRSGEASALLEALVAGGDESIDTRLSLLALYLDADEIDEAEKLGRGLVAKNPTEGTSYLALGSVYETEERWQEARKLYRDGVRRVPEDARLYDALARVAQALDRPDEEIELLEKRLEIDSEDPGALARLTELHLSRHDLAAAAKVVERVVTSAPTDLDARVQLGGLYYKLGRSEDAVRTLEPAVTSLSSSGRSPRLLAQARLILGVSYMMIRRLDDAIATFEALVAAPGDSKERFSMARAQLGVLYVRKGRIPEAIEMLSSVEQEPGLDAELLGQTRYFLALAYATGSKDRALAEELLGKVGPQAGTYVDAQLLLSTLLEQEGRFPDALAAVDRAIARRDDIDAQIRRAELMQSSGDPSGAVAWLERLIRKRPKDGFALYYQLGLLHKGSGEDTRAVTAMQQALALEGDNPAALNFIGYEWADQGVRLDEAEKMIRRAVAQRPDDAQIVDSLGWVLYKRGLAQRQAGQENEARESLEGAIVELEHAAALSTIPVIARHLGDAYRTVSRYDEALRSYRRALALGPNDAEQTQIRLEIEALEQRLAGSRSGEPD